MLNWSVRILGNILYVLYAKNWLIWACHPITALFLQLIWHENSIQNYERLLVLTASRVAENKQTRKSTKEILRSEFRSKNKTGQQKFIFNR